MPILHVRNVPDDLYQQLKTRAKMKKRSLSAEVTILLEAALQTQDVAQTNLLKSIRQRRFLRPETVDAPDSLSLLREDRAR